jgi:hypothetical protein
MEGLSVPTPGWKLNSSWVTNGPPTGGKLSFEYCSGNGVNFLGCFVNKRLRNELTCLVLTEPRDLVVETSKLELYGDQLLEHLRLAEQNGSATLMSLVSNSLYEPGSARLFSPSGSFDVIDIAERNVAVEKGNLLSSVSVDESEATQETTLDELDFGNQPPPLKRGEGGSFTNLHLLPALNAPTVMTSNMEKFDLSDAGGTNFIPQALKLKEMAPLLHLLWYDNNKGKPSAFSVESLHKLLRDSSPEIGWNYSSGPYEMWNFSGTL